GGGGEARGRVDRREPRRALGPAQQARAKTRAFGRGGGWPEGPVLPFRRARGADTAAIDARRQDADIKTPVEPPILGVARGMAGVCIQHRANMRVSAAFVSPDSDMLAAAGFPGVAF